MKIPAKFVVFLAVVFLVVFQIQSQTTSISAEQIRINGTVILQNPPSNAVPQSLLGRLSSGEVVETAGSGISALEYNYDYYWNPTNAMRYIVPQSKLLGNFSNLVNFPLAGQISFVRRNERIWLRGLLGVTGGGAWQATNLPVFFTPLGYGSADRDRWAAASISPDPEAIPLPAYVEVKQTNSIHVYAGSKLATNVGGISARWVDMTGSYLSAEGLNVATNMYGTNLTLLIWSYPPPLKPTELVYYLHGAGGSPDTWEGDLIWNTNKTNITAELAANRIVIVSPRADGNAWGSNPSYDEVIAQLDFARRQFPTITNVTVVANSMGGLLGARLMTNSFITRGYFIEPVLSLYQMSRTSQFTNQIRTRYGYQTNFSDYNTLTAGFDPLNFPTNAFAGDRIFIRFSNSDTVVPGISNAIPFEAKFGVHSSITLTNATGEHGDPSHFIPAEVRGFVLRSIP